MRQFTKLCVVTLISSMIGGVYFHACHSHTKKISLGYQSVLIGKVPHIKQKPDFCGEACVAMYMQKLGYKVDQDYVFGQMKVNPLLKRGAITQEMALGLKRIGFEPGKVWFWISVANAKDGLEARWKALHQDLLQKIPSIVCMRYDSSVNTTEHFRLILGYDSKKDEVIYHEPAERQGAYLRMKRKLFLQLWPLKYEKKRWLLVHMRLKAGKLKRPRIKKVFTDAGHTQHIIKR